jgi:hypothetical protein
MASIDDSDKFRFQAQCAKCRAEAESMFNTLDLEFSLLDETWTTFARAVDMLGQK